MKKRLLMQAAVLTLAMAAGSAAADSQPASLYERLGGQPAIRAVVDDLVSRIFADERINAWFSQTTADPQRAEAYKKKLGDLVCQATGGPCKYTGLDMTAAHMGRGITPEAFNAVVEDLTASLDKFKVPEREKRQLLDLLAPLKTMIVQH